MILYILIGLGIAGLIVVWLSYLYVSEHVRRHGIHNIIGRSLSGRRTDGKHHTNASFWRKSDGIVRGHPVGRVGKRHHRAGIANLARKIGWITATGLTVYGIIESLTITIILVSMAVTALAGYKLFRLVIRLRVWYVNRTVITPMAEALGPLLELTGPEMETNITLKPNYAAIKSGELGRIAIPPRFPNFPAQQDAIEHVITSRLPVGADVIPRMSGRTPYLLLRAAPVLPSMIRFRDYLTEMEGLGSARYLAGINPQGESYLAEFKGEEPHHGYCWGTGVGKSTKLKSILAQCKHNEPDMTATIIDPKEISLECLKGVPGFDFYDDASEFEQRIGKIGPDEWEEYMPGMWRGVKSSYDLMTYRYGVMKADRTKVFPTHLVIMEEANSLAIMSRTWWQRNKPRGMNATVPIWADWIAPLFWRGRQANIFIVLVAQSIQERFLGNLNLRPSLGLVSLAKYKPSQYQNYIGTTPIPRMQKGKGRALFNDGESDTWVQCLYASDEEFRDWALANVRNAGDAVLLDTPASWPGTSPALPPAGGSGVHVITSAVPRPRNPAP